jgi:putative ABC transport system ATP-binding protein
MIVCEHLTKTYRIGGEDTLVLKGISFSIQAGEYVAIMGPSGSGKSTLMHILGMLDVPTSGTYLLQGKDVGALSDDALAQRRLSSVGFVFQSFNLLPRATVLRNVMLPLVYAGVPREKREAVAREALASVGLEESRFHHRSNQLSGGQMQRVAIARAFVNQPSLILADEPTGALDEKNAESLTGLLLDLQRQTGTTLVMVTHHPAQAARMGRVLNIHEGRL